MKYVNIDDLEGEEFEDSPVQNIMIPVDKEEKPMKNYIISHRDGSHTLAPSVVCGPNFP